DSPARRRLYRSGRLGVILTVLIGAQLLPAQFARKETASPGPRALGLVEVAANGTAHLIPITIMYQGQFYDASAYKAAPVPMALHRGAVCEGSHTGVSQGLFTISGVEKRADTGMAGGPGKREGEKPPKQAAAPPKPTSDDELDKPPVLRRPG